MSLVTVSISSGLLLATYSVNAASASLLMIVKPAVLYRIWFFLRNSKKQAAAILLLPSTKE